MKFGKRMRGLATKEWESGYVDYKQLKRQIRQLQDQQQQKQQQLTCGGDGDVSDTSDGPSAAQQTFLALLSHEMDKINMAHTRLQTQLEVVELGALRSALGSRWVLSPAKARSLLLDAIELSQRVDALRRFVVLNSLALVKIAKKCDKVLGTNVRSVVLEALKTQSFYDAEGLDRVCADASALTDRIMLCVLPDGNFRIDASAVACPICLCADVRTPISLACGHAFCWSCLSKAAEHRFNSCPLCRKAQSLDPRYYEIDGLLKRFKRAYAFVEQGLDRAPFAASRMRQILAEAFEVVNAHLAEIDEQYASVSPPASLCGDARESTTSELSSTATERDGLDAAVDGIDSSTTSKKQVADIDELPAPAATTIVIATSSDDAEQAEPEPPVAELVELLTFERGDPVEILASGVWYPGMVMQCNSDATYSVLWWVHDNSQRFGQKVARAQLREPLSTDDDDSSSSSSALYDAAADAWRTATEWALEPFRRLRSLSSSSERVVS